MKISKWTYFKVWFDFKYRIIFKLNHGQSLWNKIYEDWGADKHRDVFGSNYLFKVLREIRNEIHKLSLRGGPHVVILRNKAAKLFNEYDNTYKNYWLLNRSYLKKIFQVKYNDSLRKDWNIITIETPTFSKENPTSIFDIEAIHFMGNLKHEYINDGESWMNNDLFDAKGKKEVPSINLKFVTEKQPDIVIKRNI